MKPDDRLAAMRRRVLREWRGCDDAVASGANVRLAGEFLAGILAQTGTADGIDEARLREAWRALAGDLIASQCEPVGLRKGEVSLRVRRARKPMNWCMAPNGQIQPQNTRPRTTVSARVASPQSRPA